jgi:hypothetical protein
MNDCGEDKSDRKARLDIYFALRELRKIYEGSSTPTPSNENPMWRSQCPDTLDMILDRP